MKYSFKSANLVSFKMYF